MQFRDLFRSASIGIIPNLGTLLPNVPSAGGDYIIGDEK